jgi:hypothetical protein
MGLNENNRIHWAAQAVGFAADGSTTYTRVKGLQSIGTTTTFNLEQVFELGQLAIYENIEEIPDIEVTMEKVLDGDPLLYHLSTPNATSSSLIGRSAEQCAVALSIFGETQDSASGIPNSQVTMSGLYVSSLGYTLPADGNCTESVTLVGNHKIWATGVVSGDFTFTGAIYDNTDTPSSGVQRRQDVIFGSGTNSSTIPGGNNAGGIPGVTAAGKNLDSPTGNGCTAHVSNLSFSADYGREALNELGHKSPYFRFVNLPVEVSTEIEVISSDGDLVSATEEGVAGGGNNLTDHTIIVKLADTTIIDCGTKNKLSNVSYGGGDAGGGNVTTTFSYVTHNDLTITQANDPAGL